MGALIVAQGLSISTHVPWMTTGEARVCVARAMGQSVDTASARHEGEPDAGGVVSGPYRPGKSSWANFWAGKPLPPRPPDCPAADYEEFHRHVAEDIAIAALVRASGERVSVVMSRLDKTHRRLHRPATRHP
jgi:hypothetical protein